MSTKGGVRGELGRLFDLGASAGLSDAELLDRFRRDRDNAAFEAIVRRHGPMVLATCRGELGNLDDADDAFQAVFLVLSRKAESVRGRESLGPWLHRVARHASVRAGKSAGRRLAQERKAAAIDPSATDDDRIERSETISVVREETARLPEPFRSPVVLCGLEGLSHEEAAARLNRPVGTIRSRLARGRERLRLRLIKRGLAPTVAVSATLIERTVRSSTIGEASGTVSTIGEGVIQTMFVRYVGTIATATALSLGLLVASASTPPKTAPSPAPQAVELPGEWKDLSGDWRVTAVEGPKGKLEPRAAGFDECRILAPYKNAETGRDQPGWFIFFLEKRLFCEPEVTSLDPKAKPKQATFRCSRDPVAGPEGRVGGLFRFGAIYKVTADELTLCLGGNNAEIPGSFSASKDSGRLLVTFRRKAAPSR